MSLQLKLLLVLVGVLGIGIASPFVSALDLDKLFIALVLLAFTSFIAEIYELEIIPHWSLSSATAVKLAAIFIGGAPLGIWVILLSTLPAEILLRWDDIRKNLFAFFSKVIFNVGQLAISVVIASFTFQIFGGHSPPYHSIVDYLLLILAFLAYEIVSASLVSVAVSLANSQKFSHILQYSLRNLHIQFLTMGVIAGLMAVLYTTSPWNLLLAIIPLVLIHYSVRSYLRLRSEAHAAFAHITDLLAQRDVYTGVHSKDVEDWALSLSKALDLSNDYIATIKMGAAIHDIGKIAVPDSILHKPGTLTDEEWIVMKKHPVVGADILKNLEIYRDVVPIVKHEHEHWDGSGYPDGLRGEAIPIGARIIAVADVYSALTTERQYRPPQGKPLKYTQEQACEILKDMTGKVLDPHLVDVFINKVLKKKEAP